MTARVGRYQKGKTNVVTEARDSECQWHQLGRMQVCTSLQTDNHASSPPLRFFTGRMPFLQPNQQRQNTEGTYLFVDFLSRFRQCIRQDYRSEWRGWIPVWRAQPTASKHWRCKTDPQQIAICAALITWKTAVNAVKLRWECYMMISVLFNTIVYNAHMSASQPSDRRWPKNRTEQYVVSWRAELIWGAGSR